WIPGIDLDYPSEAMRFVRMEVCAETLIHFMPAIAEAAFDDAVACLAGQNLLLSGRARYISHVARFVGKIAIPVYLAGVISSPGGEAVGAMVECAQNPGAAEVGRCYHQIVVGSRSAELADGVARDTPVKRRRALDFPCAAFSFFPYFDHADA